MSFGCKYCKERGYVWKNQGLLNLALDGLTRLRKNNSFTSNKRGIEIKKHWARRSNSFNAFFMDYLSVDDDESILHKSELRKAYNKYCRAHKSKIVSDVLIKKFLESKGVSEDKETSIIDGKSRKNIWVGIKFKDDVKGDKGFSTYSEILNFDIGVKSIDTLDQTDSKSDFVIEEKIIYLPDLVEGKGNSFEQLLEKSGFTG